MPRLLQRYATPLITGLFLVSLVSGVALFFHIGPSGFHGMHEWLSMVLIVPFVLHLWRNWRSMKNYFTGSPFALSIAASVIAALVFVLPGSSDGERRDGPPQFALVERLLQSDVEQMAPVLGVTAEQLGARLASAGFVVNDNSESLRAIVDASGKNTFEMSAALLAAGDSAN